MIDPAAALHYPGMRVNLSPNMTCDETPGTSGERRLWAAVILTVFHEYEDWCSRIAAAWQPHQRPVPHSYIRTLNQIRRQCKHTWFRLICEMADVAPYLIIRKLDALDKEYCIAAIPVEPESDDPPTAWKLRQMSQRKRPC